MAVGTAEAEAVEVLPVVGVGVGVGNEADVVAAFSKVRRELIGGLMLVGIEWGGSGMGGNGGRPAPPPLLAGGAGWLSRLGTSKILGPCFFRFSSVSGFGVDSRGETPLIFRCGKGGSGFATPSPKGTKGGGGGEREGRSAPNKLRFGAHK